MKQVCDTVGGWMWWVNQWKQSHPEEVPDYKIMVQQYIKGEKFCPECGLLQQHKMSCDTGRQK